jgi:hypothetical protein
MATYPALVQLVRMLGRQDALSALGVVEEPDPTALDDAQRDRLRSLVEMRLESVAAELANEAGASDDVTDSAGGRVWIDDRLAAFDDLLEPDQRERLREAAYRFTRDWG